LSREYLFGATDALTEKASLLVQSVDFIHDDPVANTLSECDDLAHSWLLDKVEGRMFSNLISNSQAIFFSLSLRRERLWGGAVFWSKGFAVSR
jgi:hypothetical protein